LQSFSDHFNSIQDGIQSLEDRLAKAMRLLEQVKVLQSLKNFLPREEVEMISAKSEAKIEEARVLHKLVNDWQKKSGFMTNETMQIVAQTLNNFKFELNAQY